METADLLRASIPRVHVIRPCRFARMFRLVLLEGRGGFAGAFHVQGTRSGVAIIGEVDTFSGATFSSALAGVGAATADAVVLDFGGLEFVDLDAMRRLAAFARTMEDRNRSVLVNDASDIVRRVWQLIAPTFDAHLQFVSGGQ